MYLHSATSYGSGDDIDKIVLGYPQKTLYKHLYEHNIEWRVYYSDGPGTLLFGDMRTPSALARHKPFFEFKKHAEEGTLAPFSYIDPRYYDGLGFLANDQHPSHSVAEGEKLFKEIYETLRNSVSWNQSLLIITYDEHGGFYDHVPTPLKNVPNPDGRNSTKPPFGFDRLGIRVPAIAISPYIKKGTIYRAKNGHLEHSSVPATMIKWFNISTFLTKRDAWAGTFEDIASLTSPRTDCPKTLPDVVIPTFFEGKTVTDKPMSGLQKELVQLASALNSQSLFSSDDLDSMTEFQGGEFVRTSVANYFSKKTNY